MINLYDSNLITHKDWDFKIRLIKKFSVVFCPDPLVERRRNPIGLSHLPAYQQLKSMEMVYEKNRHLLGDLSTLEQTKIVNKLLLIFSRLALNAVKEEIRKGHPRLGIRYFLENCHYFVRV